jgi:long-chain acyl-CoA synthetase
MGGAIGQWSDMNEISDSRCNSSIFIGVPDDYQMTCVKAFVIVDREQSSALDAAEIKRELLAHCKKHLIKWSVPRDIEFRQELPSTLVGKVSYTALEREEQERRHPLAAQADVSAPVY